MNSTPYESRYYCEVAQKYAINPNSGTFNEYCEEFMSLAALDWFSFVKKIGRGVPEFCISDSVKTWMRDNSAFHKAAGSACCFFSRRKNDPFPGRERLRRTIHNVQRPRTRKKQAKRIHSDIERELRKMDGTARGQGRREERQKIREMKIAMWAISQLVLIYFVESAPSISEECYQKLCAVAPSASENYVRRDNGRYAARKRDTAGHLLGQAGADVILISRLERFSKYMGYLQKK